ncbi:cytochrome P450 [Cunninghamella echinulata]|nr:cytochrome P450 [Cunninghamella echinulata]
MLTQYMNRFINSFDQRKTVNSLQKIVTSKEGAIGIATAVILMAGVSVYKSKKKFNRGCPRVPDSNFLFGCSEDYLKDPQGFIEKWRKELGDVYCANLLGDETVIVSGPQALEIFNNKNLSFLDGIFRNFNSILLTDSAFTIKDGSESLTELIIQSLNPNLDHYTPRIIESLTAAFHEYVGQVPAEGLLFEHGFPIIQHMVAKASATVFVGPELAKNEKLVDSFKNMVSEVGSELVPRPLMALFPSLNYIRMWYIGKTSPKVKKHRKQLADALKPEIDRRLKAMALNDSNWERPDDILQNIIESKQRPKRMTIHVFTLEVLTQFIFTALHTTAENGTIAFYRILSKPGLMDELYEEQKQVLEKQGYDKDCGPEVFTRSTFNKFVKLDSAIREAFRIKNVYIDLGHKNISKENVVLSGGAVVKPGELVHPNIYANHTDPRYQDDPNNLYEYNPYRYLGVDKSVIKTGVDYLFFGSGPHSCPGRFFASLEIKIMISFIIRYYQLTPQGNITFPTQDREHHPTDAAFKLIPRK